jgi:AGZA family xanthine/uracil permease-like MFS transporter
MISIPYTFSIADGIAIGFISYPVIKILSGKAKEVNWLLYALAIGLILRYIFL